MMTPPAPKASGRPRLARFVSLVFLLLACFVLPQQAAAQGTATASIANIDEVSEGAGNAQFTVNLDRAVNTDVILNLTYLATAAPNFGVTPAVDLGSDRQLTVTIPANETQATFNVPIVDDDIVEFNETAIVSISANTPADVMIDSRNSRGSVRITDNDTAEFSLAVDRTSAAEGVDFTFTVSLSERVARRMLVGWTATGTGDNPATLGINGSDLEAPQIDRGDVTFDALTTTSQQFTIRILDDGNPEPDETFTVTLSNPRDSFFRDETPPGLTVGSTGSQTVTIENNDGEPDTGPAEVSLRVPSEYTLPDTEDGEGLFVLNVDKDGNVAGLMEQVTFTFSTTDGTATAGTDYTAQTNQTRTISDSQEGLALPFVALADNIVEEDETFTVTFTSDTEGVGFVNGNNTTTVTIVDQDTALVSLEGDANAREDAGNITFTVELLDGDDSNPGGPFSVAENVTVMWTATDGDGTATVGDDLQRTSGTATISAGDTEATFTVPIEDDETVEGDETFTVTLSAPLVLGNSAPLVSGNIDADRVRLSPTAITATGTITDDDTPEATVSIGNASVAENVSGGNAEFTVSLTQAVTEDVTLAVAYAAGATNGATLATDLGALTDTVTIDQGLTSATLLVPIIDDSVVESDETFTVTISEGATPLPAGVTIGTNATATGTITDDDVPTVNLRAVRDVTEGAAQLRFRIDLNTDLTGDITLSWRVSGGTASAADFDDRYADTGTATIRSGRRTVPIDFAPIIDGVTEGDETLELTISNPPSGVQIGTATATGTISNSDAAAVNIANESVAENGGHVDFTVSLSRAVDSAVVLDVIYEGTGDNPVELARDLGSGRPGTVTIDRGQTEATITVQVNNDALVEGDETFVVILRERNTDPLPDGVIIDDGSAIGTIVDNETGQVTLGPATLEAAENGTFTYTVSLSAAADEAVTVRWTATDGTAMVADDLQEKTDTVTFPVRDNRAQEFTISPFDDDAVEGNETFTVTLEVDGDNPLPTGVTIGTNNSSTATITDNDDAPAAVAPQITTQPTDQSVTVGENATFTVAATGTPTPTYQWRFEGTDISGATSASYTLSNAALTNAGDYTVVVTNTAGTVTSSAATLTVTPAAVAPQITTQPTDQSVTVGDNATFTVAATGTPTPTYQWRFDGSDISGATSETYTLSNAALTNAGDYTVVVTNTAGTVTSTAATLTVTAAAVAPQITTQPTDQSVTVGDNATFTVAATGTPTPTYQWRFDGSDISGATSASYTLSNAALTNAGDYTVVVTNTAGTVTSTAATLTVTPAAVAPQITTQPTDQSVTVGDNATFTVAATGTPTPTYQWRFDGSDISGATSETYTLSNAALTNAGDYTVVVTNTAGTVTSTAATLTVTAAAVAPEITTQPTDQSVTVGDNATFTVAATGTPTPTYQWRFDGSDISGATSETYTLSNAALTNAGDYTVVVTNTAGTVTSTAATLTVTAAAVAPQITTQPTDQSVTVGENATFTVAATGTPTPTYQWRKDGTDISGATSASYTLSNAALTNAGDYTVVVTNTAGTVTSTAATLTVTAATVAPAITTQPTDQSVTVGENATFTVAATGTPTPTYQWRFEGTDISGATSASYTLSNAALTNAGDYTVVVTNTAGTVTSSAATLTVTPAAVAPQITTQPTDQSVTVGDNATFTVAATGTPTPTYQWRFDGSDISGATSETYTLSNAALTNAGDYTVVVTNTAGTVTSTAATLTVTAAAVAPQITTQPTDQSVTVGDNATFTVAATGTPTPTYQWRFEGSDISGATSETYTLSNAALTNAGDYTVVVTNTAGTVTSTAATLTVTAATVAPAITTQPTDQSVTVGDNATFTVAATGTPTPTYQWRFDGSDISGATSETYTLSNAALTNAGDYTVVVTNTAGTVTSTAATLTVTAAAVAPQITTQPTDQSVTVGDNATFTVAATGTPTPTYQWRFDGSDISGATSASYTLSNAALTNAGDYTVVVTNTAGTVTSTAATLTVTPAAVAPQITTQPTDQSVTVGDNATFTVAATGTPTPTYQWRFDGSDISGATSETYTLSNAALTNAGDYTVVVTNTAGTVTSTAATLTVTAAAVAPQITTQPTDQSVTVGDNATFTVAATGTPTPTYQWRFDGSDISGATSASYTLSNAALTNAGDYTVVVTNTAGTVTSTAATLTVTPAAVAPQITTQPTDQSVTVGDNATFTVAATGTPTPTYQWRFDGSDISGATSETYTLSNAALTNAGDYTVVVTNTAGTVTSTAATLTVTAAAVAPEITTQPTDQSVTVGDNATFTVAATGTPTPTYQWRFEGSDISGATSATYTLSNAALTNAGDYTVVVTNTAGTVTSTAATLTVTAAAVAPQITTQPTDQSVTVGENATFTVAATGTPTPTYQWRKDGTDISGATSASYTLSNAALTNAGDYTVVVTNTAGTVTSTAATLTVTAATVAPAITTQPTDQSVTVGETATFTVTATGSPTPTYQWRFEGSDIAGATSASYTLSNAALTNAGDYTVVVTNTAGTVTSSAATLTVTPAAVAPQITTQPTDQSVTVGDNATFTVAATGTPTPTYQWRFDGSDISGATSETYTLSNAALTNAGDYTVVVTNTAGTVTSTAATLTVTAAAVAPQITTQPTDQSVTVGDNATFTVAATGTPTPTYQWRFEGSDISGATSASYTLSSAALTDAGDYTVVVTNTAGTVTSSAATLTVTAAAVAPAITTQPTDQSVTVGGSATFTVTATGTPTPTYQWRFEGSDISGATSATYTLSSAVLTDAGDYTVVVTNTAGTVTSTAATLTVTAAAVAPQITTQPTDQSVTVGGSATFTVTATGTPTPTYQWRFEGSDISGATSATYTLSGAALTDAGDYTVVVTNTAGTVTSTAATLTVTAAAVAPQITTQPTDQSVTVGENATFTVAATGTPTPTYQWRFEGSDISGATSASYTLSSAALTDAGDYTVVVTNTAGTVTSSAATLTVTAAAVAPQITTQPTDQSVTVGENATFTVAATGTPTPTYQWRFEGSDISGATSASYAISSAALTNAGDYTVVVTNTAGTVTSNAATLTVTAVAPEPSVLIEPRLIAAGTALRRHISRFDSLTGTVARSRLDARKTRRLSGSKDLGDGALATGGTLGESRWGAWIDGAWAGFGGTASGRQADVYGGVDYLDGDWLIGALIGYEVADLEIGEATYRSDYTHLGIYGGARLSERLLFDGAVTYGTATPDIALGDVSASYDARRLTARGALTGDFGLEYGLWTGSVKVQPRLGLLYSRERLGPFTDSAGGVAEREILDIGRFIAGPRLTWDFDGVRVVGGTRVQLDFLGLDDGTGGRISGAADIGVNLDLTPNVTLGAQGDVDGIGVSDEFGSLGGKVELGVRF